MKFYFLFIRDIHDKKKILTIINNKLSLDSYSFVRFYINYYSLISKRVKTSLKLRI